MKSLSDQIREYAEEAGSEECCGILLEPESGFLPALLPCENVALEPRDTFEIASADYLGAYKTHRMLAYYHSHPRTVETPSKPDRDAADLAALPVYIYSLQTQRLGCYRPQSAVKPYVDRAFVLQVQDCVSLMQDYYSKELGIEDLYIPERTVDVLKKGFTETPNVLKNAGLEPIDINDRQEHDVIFCRIDSMAPNHVAVYVDENTVFEQRINTRSQQKTFKAIERDAVVALRHNSRL